MGHIGGVLVSSKLTPVLYLSPFAEVEKRVPKLPYRMLPGRIALMQHPIMPSESGILAVAGRNFAVWVCEDCGEASRREPMRCENCGGFRITETRKYIGEADDTHLEPDVCVVADSAIGCFKPGDVLVVKPEAGALIPAPTALPAKVLAKHIKAGTTLHPLDNREAAGGWDGWDKRSVRLLGLPGMPWQERILARLTEKGVEPMPGWSLVERERVKLGSLESKEAYEPYGTCLSGVGQGEKVVWTDRDESYTFLGAPKSWALVRSQRNMGAFSRAC